MMRRRDALKNISLGMGATISAPALVSFISSCGTATDAATTINQTVFSPAYLNKQQYNVVRLFLDKLLPKTDSPGALEVKVPQIIDALMHKVFDSESQTDFKNAWNGFATVVKSDQNIDVEKEELTDEHMEAFFVKYMNPKEEATLKQAQKLTDTPIKEIDIANKPLANTYKFIRSLSDMGVNIFYRTEEIATNYLNFDPIPGVFNGCLPLEEVGNKLYAH